MDRFTPTVGCMCGAMLIGEYVFPGGWILGGLLGIWVGWPKKEENGPDISNQVQESD
jgi:hypothetical protein